LGDDDEFAQLQSCGDHLLAELSQVVIAAVCELSDEAMQSEALEQPGDLADGFIRQEAAQGFVLQSGDVELATGNGAELGFVVAV